MIRINSFYKYLFFFIAIFITLLFFSETSKSQELQTRNAACGKNGTGEITDSNAVDGACEIQPTTQKIKFYKVAFCTAIPTAPTLTAATVMTNCSTVFENRTGTEVSIQKNVGTEPTGTFTDPPFGKYTYVYVEIDPIVKYTSSFIFSTPSAISSADAPGTDGEQFCRTNGDPFFHWGNLAGITCNDAAADATESQVTLNSLDNNPDPAVGLSSARFAGTNGNTDVYLITTDGFLANTAVLNGVGNVSKVIAFMPANLNMTPDISTYNLLYNNTLGMTVFKTRDGATINSFIGFSIAYFDMTFTIQ